MVSMPFTDVARGNQPRKSRHGINANRCRVGALTSCGNEQLPKIRRKEARARSLYRRKLGNFFVMVGILLLVYRNPTFATCCIDLLASFVIEYVVRIADC